MYKLLDEEQEISIINIGEYFEKNLKHVQKALDWNLRIWG